MKIIYIAAIVAISGSAVILADEPAAVSSAQFDKTEWFIQREHPASIQNIFVAKGWTHLRHNQFRIAVLIGMDQTDGESNIPVSAYIYNESFKEWRRFMNLHVRNAYSLNAGIDSKRGTLELTGGLHSPLKGKTISSFSLTATSNDQAYIREEKKPNKSEMAMPRKPSD